MVHSTFHLALVLTGIIFIGYLEGQNPLVSTIWKTTVCSTANPIPALNCQNVFTDNGTQYDGHVYIIQASIHAGTCNEHPNNKACHADVTQSAADACSVQSNRTTCTLDLNANPAQIVTADTCFLNSERQLTVHWMCIDNPCRDIGGNTTCGALANFTCTNDVGLKYRCTPV